MKRSFALTYDYLCPFACIVHDLVTEALRAGAEWEVDFVPFSLSQVHTEEGDEAVWDRPIGAHGTSGVLAHAWAIAVAQLEPHLFLDFHSALFEARHRRALDINDPQVLTDVARSVGVDVEATEVHVMSGEPLEVLASRHSEAVKRHSVFGVPTIIAGDEAAFVRLMRRDPADLERVLDMVEWSNLNEFKRTTIPR